MDTPGKQTLGAWRMDTPSKRLLLETRTLEKISSEVRLHFLKAELIRNDLAHFIKRFMAVAGNMRRNEDIGLMS